MIVSASPSPKIASNPLDNVEKGDMTLTGQVFSVMCNVATDKQVEEIIKAADYYLYDEAVAGYKLNTNYNEIKTNMGRLFGFAYGHKENGAMFSHMAVMYANGLYKRGFAHAGYKVLNTIYTHCIDLSKSKIISPCVGVNLSSCCLLFKHEALIENE